MAANRVRVAVFVLIVAFSTPLLAGLGQSAMNVEGLTIDVTSVERKGNVLTVKWAVKNSGTADGTVEFHVAGGKPNTYLVDEENGTKYYVLTDKEGNALASDTKYTGNGYAIWETIPAGGTRRYWAKYPAPPAAVKTINLMFSKAEPIESIAITDKQ